MLTAGESKEVIIFEYKLSTSGSDSTKCATVGRFKLPGEVEGPIGIASLRGAILVQSATGQLLLIGTSSEALML